MLGKRRGARGDGGAGDRLLRRPRARAAGGSLVLPDAPRGRVGSAGGLPEMWDAARAGARFPEAADDAELSALRRRFVWGLALSAPVVATAMIGMAPESALGSLLHHQLSDGVLGWGQLALTTPVVFWIGRPFLASGFAGRSAAAPACSRSSCLGFSPRGPTRSRRSSPPARSPEARHAGSVMLYFEAAASIIVLVLLGQLLEARARSRAGEAIRGLLALRPAAAHRIAAGIEEDVPLERVHVGDELRVRPGEKIPVDGIVVSGARRSTRAR